MTSPKRKRLTTTPSETSISVEIRGGENERQALAHNLAGPFARHGLLAEAAAERVLDNMDTPHKPALAEFAVALKQRSNRAATGDMAQTSALLFAQAFSLDAICTEYARIALRNIEKADATERYLRLALRAQAGSRAALEAHARLHQPREQTVRHIHVNEGGQAVIAEQFHHRVGGSTKDEVNQPHAQCSRCTALSCKNAQRQPMPSPSYSRQAPVQNARRKK